MGTVKSGQEQGVWMQPDGDGECTALGKDAEGRLENSKHKRIAMGLT